MESKEMKKQSSVELEDAAMDKVSGGSEGTTRTCPKCGKDMVRDTCPHCGYAIILVHPWVPNMD